MPAVTLDRDELHKGYVDLDKHELRNPVLQQLAADPATPVEGQFFERSDTKKLRVRLNGQWVDLATMADVTANGISAAIMDAKGDLIVGTGTDAAARKAVGANGTTLFANSAQGDGLEWRAIAQGDVTGLVAALAAKQATISVADSATLDLTLTGAQISGAVLDSPTVGGATAAQLRDRATHTGAQAIATITGLQAALDAKVDDAQVGAANGVASLDAGGKIPSSQLPALSLTDVNVVADIAARDALSVQEGDVAIVTGTSQSFIYDGTTWQEITSPVDGVTAVTGGTGITSTGGTTPQISITAGGVGTTQLADNAVTAAKLAAAVAGNGLTGGGGTALAVNPGTGLEISADAVRIAAAAAGNGLVGGGGAALAVGAGTGITVSADAVAIDTGVVLRKAAGALTGGANSEVLTHNLNTRDVKVILRNNAAPYDELEGVYNEATTVNTVTVYAASGNNLPAGYRWVIIG